MTHCRGKGKIMSLSKFLILSLSAMTVIVVESSGTDLLQQGSMHSSIRRSSNRNMIVDREKVTLIEEQRYKLEKGKRSADPSNRMYLTEHMRNKAIPSNMPSNMPSYTPSNVPSNAPSNSNVPSNTPTSKPSNLPSYAPSNVPSKEPSNEPSNEPSEAPTLTSTKSSLKEGNIETTVNSTASHDADFYTVRMKGAEDSFYNETHDEIGSVAIEHQQNVGRSRSYAVTTEEEWYLSESEMRAQQPYTYRTSTGKSEKSSSKSSKSSPKANKV